MAGSAKIWSERFNEQRSLGISVVAYCEKKGIHPSRFYYWKQKLHKPTAKERFVPVVTSGGKLAQEKMFALEFPDGTRMVFPESVGDERLARVVASVKRGMA